MINKKDNDFWETLVRNTFDVVKVLAESGNIEFTIMLILKFPENSVSYGSPMLIPRHLKDNLGLLLYEFGNSWKEEGGFPVMGIVVIYPVDDKIFVGVSNSENDLSMKGFMVKQKEEKISLSECSTSEGEQLEIFDRIKLFWKGYNGIVGLWNA